MTSLEGLAGGFVIAGENPEWFRLKSGHTHQDAPHGPLGSVVDSLTVPATAGA
jgi:hypothetical protein